jgi:hypothetical protein
MILIMLDSLIPISRTCELYRGYRVFTTDSSCSAPWSCNLTPYIFMHIPTVSLMEIVRVSRFYETARSPDVQRSAEGSIYLNSADFLWYIVASSYFINPIWPIHNYNFC